MPASKKTSAGKPANARPKAPTARAKGPAATPAPVLADVRAQIDGIDRRIQELIAQRAGFALQVGKAKGKLAAAVDYYRPEREAQVLRMVVDRIDRLADGRQVIIDYKTGASIDTKNWAAQRITEPQLPIYAALVNDEVAAVVFAKVLLDKPAFAGVADEKDILPGVQGIGDDKQKIFDPAEFPDWVAVVTHWRERLHAVAGEVKAGVAGVSFADEKGLQYCEVLPLLRLAERRRLLAATAEQFVETGSDSGT